MNYGFLLSLAIILLSTKLFGIATEKVHLPQVVGSILAGLILGPSVLGWVHESEFLVKTSEIGVIMLMFIAGLDTDFAQLKKTGKAAFLVALCGVVVPIIGCGLVYYFFFIDAFTFHNVIKMAFVGVVFAATSVSITVETLNEMGKLNSEVGSTILNAAIIDDIIGIIVLSLVMGFADATENPLLTVGKIFAFFAFAVIVGFVIYKVFKRISKKHGQSRRIAVWALAFAFILSYIAERYFGVADITGAYVAGVVLCNLTDAKKELARKMTVASYVIFTPVFFASIGIKTQVRDFTPQIALFTILLIASAMLTKIIGCGFAARLSGLKSREAFSVGIGMVARGEVALMVAQKGISAGFIDTSILPAIVLCIITMSLLTPIMLKLSFRK